MTISRAVLQITFAAQCHYDHQTTYHSFDCVTADGKVSVQDLQQCSIAACPINKQHAVIPAKGGWRAYGNLPSVCILIGVWSELCVMTASPGIYLQVSVKAGVHTPLPLPHKARPRMQAQQQQPAAPCAACSVAAPRQRSGRSHQRSGAALWACQWL